MNILLIFPMNEPFDTVVAANQTPWKSKLERKTKRIKKVDCTYPSGVLSIASYLEKHVPGTKVKILDYNAMMNQIVQERDLDFDAYKLEHFLQEGLDRLGDFLPDVIGVSTLFCSVYMDLKQSASFLRRQYPDKFIFCGGHVATSLYDRMHKDRMEFDAVCYGEGEIPTRELLEAMNAGNTKEYLAASPSWVTDEKMRFAAANGKLPMVNKVLSDLDEVPPFDFNMLMSPHAYFNSTRYFFVIETREEIREMFMFSTRGCPYSCVFCASSNVHGKKVRSYSLERIKHDIMLYNREHNIRRFVFYDDHFLLLKDRAIQILDFIAQQGLIAEIPTPAFFSINRDVAQAMARAGIKEVNITLESGNEYTMKNIIHKPANLQIANEAVQHLTDAGILSFSNILIGFPGETKEAIDEGEKFLLSTKINWYQCFVVAPLPGSPLYELCREKGYLVENDSVLAMDFKRCLIKTEHWTPEYIEKRVYQMNLNLNFVNNYDMRAGNYETALMLFERVLFQVIDTHAFAYYYAAQCCRKLRYEEKFKLYKAKHEEMVAAYPFWRDYAQEFKLTPLEDYDAERRSQAHQHSSQLL